MDTQIRVPTINVRTKIPQGIIEEVARRIVVQFHPQKIILFGSYAYGTPKPESDVDLLIIMNTNLRETMQAQKIRQFLIPLFGLDLVVYTPANLLQRLEWGDPFLVEVLTKGKVLYESIDE